MSGRKPDYVLKVQLADTKNYNRAGAAWKLEKGGGIAIKLDPGIALVGANDVRITLWPNEDRPKGGASWQG